VGSLDAAFFPGFRIGSKTPTPKSYFLHVSDVRNMALKPNQLKDKSIREAYRKAIDEKKPIVGLKDVANIIRAAMDGKVITKTERRDILLIIKESPMTTESRSKLQDFMHTRFKYQSPTAKECKDIARVLEDTNHTRFINFSFGDNDYVTTDYAYIAQKVLNGDIDVYTYSYSEDTSSPKHGVYNSLADELYIADLLDSRTELQRYSTIIHEATHAIQDKQNKSLLVRQAEAAAHIAQAIMLLQVGAGSTKLLYSRLKEPGIRDAALKIYNTKSGKRRAVLTENEQSKALEVIDKSKAYGGRSKNRTAMDAEWYSFFETLAYKLGV
jgi:hypothetical protein